MSHTNSTTHYSLPQFVTSDKPAWLTDINNAYTAIDTGIYNAQTDATTANRQFFLRLLSKLHQMVLQNYWTEQMQVIIPATDQE